MRDFGSNYIDGEWVAPTTPGRRELVNPTTEEAFATVASGGGVDEVNLAVAAAKRAFESYSRTSASERIALIDRIITEYSARVDEFSDTIAEEVGIPKTAKVQAEGPIGHMKVARDLLRTYAFETRIGDTVVRREPIGVCALISPWNWPIQTPLIKLIYALAAGCTIVMKPSDASPLGSILLTQVLEKAGIPPGVVNLVIGKGRVVGEALSGHPDVDMVSFTGSTAAGVKVGEAAARTVKRVCLELGGKSANIVMRDADLEGAARWNIQRAFFNTGQSCHAPSRMLVHKDQVEDVIPFLVDEAARFEIGDPMLPDTTMGPMANKAQYDSVQKYIQIGIDEGARLVCGGTGRPDGINRGFFTRPTVFVDVAPEMTIAREEIFGPVLAVIPYDTEEDALSIANDTVYGLGGYVFASDSDRGYEFSKSLRAGRVAFNGANTNSLTPMGGYKQSGIGRSMGVFGLEEYLEVKSIYGLPEHAAPLPEHVA